MYSSKAIRYLMFGLLYFTQGIILSYFTSLNALYFLSNGLTMTDAGDFRRHCPLTICHQDLPGYVERSG